MIIIIVTIIIIVIIIIIIIIINIIIIIINTTNITATKNIKIFRNFLKSININERYLIEKLQEVVIRCLYFIYCRRNKNWNEPNLLLMIRK